MRVVLLSLSVDGDRFAEGFEFGRNAKPWAIRGGHATVGPLGSTLGDAHGDIAVEVRAGKEQFGRRAMGKVGDGGRDNVTTPGVLEGHADPHRDAKIARLADFGQTTELADFQVHHIHREISAALEQHFKSIDVFIEHKRMVGLTADGEALVVGSARLFDVDIEILYRATDTDRFVLGPTGVRIGHESIGRFERSAHGMDTFDIDVGISADFELESAVAFGAVSGDFGGHLFGGLLGYRSVQMKIGAVATAQERADRQRSVLAEQVPTRHVDRRFDVGVAFEGRVHSAV